MYSFQFLDIHSLVSPFEQGFLSCARLQTVLEVSVHWSFLSLHLDPTMYYCFLITFPSLGFQDGILPGFSFCFPKLFSADFFVAFSSSASPLTFRVLQHIIPRSFYLHTLSEPPWSHSLSRFSVSSIHWHFPNFCLQSHLPWLQTCISTNSSASPFGPLVGISNLMSPKLNWSFPPHLFLLSSPPCQ